MFGLRPVNYTGAPGSWKPPGMPATRENPIRMIEVKVNNEMVDRAMRELKRKLIKEGLFKELSRRKFYMKPSVSKRIKRAQAAKVRKKEAARERERMQH